LLFRHDHDIPKEGIVRIDDLTIRQERAAAQMATGSASDDNRNGR
jgi:hypothetical protein